MSLRWTRSTLVRLAMLLAFGQILSTASLLYFVRTQYRSMLEETQRELVTDMRRQLLVAYEEGGRSAIIAEIDQRLADNRKAPPVFLLTAPNGVKLAGNLDAWPPIVGAFAHWQITSLYRTRGEAPEQIGLIASTLPGGSQLLVGSVFDDYDRLRRINDEALAAAFFVAFPISILLASLGSRYIGHRLAHLSIAVDRVRAGDLTSRVEMGGSDDDFDRVAQQINSMLERIEDLVAELRMVTDGLAHDLRSPLSRLRLRIEQALAQRDDKNCRHALEEIYQETDSLLSMLTTALQISRAEAGIGRSNFEPLDAGELLAGIVELYSTTAEDAGIALSWSAPDQATFSGHRQLLSQALGNLLENAINHSGARSVQLVAHDCGSALVLWVADDGIGIPADKRAEALRRFARLDHSRQHPGSGLGLPLVEATVRLHDGALSLEDNMPGLRVVLRLPKNR